MNLLRALVVSVCLGIAATGNSSPFERAPIMFQTGISRDQAVAMMQSKYGARVVRADTAQEDGRVVYYIRLQDRSRVWTVRVDAASGREF